MLTEEQANQLKEQLLKQIAHFPEDKRAQIEQQVLEMDANEFEEFLQQNGLIPDSNQNNQIGQQCIFCSIVNGKVKSYKIYENKENIAILELNPLSKGHCLIVPKNHSILENIPNSSFEIAKKFAKKIREKYNPKEIRISSLNIFNHALLEILPLYGDEKERKKASEEELAKLQKDLFEEEPKPVEIKKEPVKKETENLAKFKARIP
ncbi:MAG: HIT family protein [Nanoarchaeota archaeon]